MAKATFELEWDDDLGKDWMNIFNLELCCYSSSHTKKALLKIREVEDEGMVMVKTDSEGNTVIYPAKEKSAGK